MKRFMRIIPTYLIAIIFGAMFSIIVGWGIDSKFVWDYLIISFYVNGSGSEWYVSAILILYLLFPLFYKLLQKKMCISWYDNKFKCSVFRVIYCVS